MLSVGRRSGLVILIAAVLLAGVLPDRALATFRLDDLGLGRLEVSGNLQSQNLIRHPDIDTLMFVMQRNTLHTRVDWDLVTGGHLLQRFRLPGVRRAKLFLLYRFVYDSIYDATPNFVPERDFRGTDVRAFYDSAGVSRQFLTLDGLTQKERDAYKFENQLREAYVDLKLTKVPLSLRVGRQQIVWGESDNFRMLDRVNTLDLTWHLAFELPPPAYGWDEIRRPFWMLKGLYDLGTLGPLSQSFLEFYWNPGDWHPAKQAFLPRPWGLQIYDPLENPVDGAFIRGPCAISNVPNPYAPGIGRCTTLMNGTKLFVRGDYDHFNPLNNSQAGVRFHSFTPQGVEFTLNYLWQRWGGDDGTNSAQVRALPVSDPDDPLEPNKLRSIQLLSEGVLPAEFYTPYVHTLGFSANYSEEQFTQTVYRLETVLDFGIPFFDRGKRTVLDTLLPGVTHKNMWKGMIGFDRFQWIRFLNRKSTFFISGQFFWHHLIDNPDCPDVVDPDFDQSGRSCLTGGADLPSALRPKSMSFRDKIRDWESLFSLALFTFYRGGSIVPVAGAAVDYVNQWNSLLFWSLDYYIRPNVAINVTQRYFITPTGEEPIFSTWGLAGLNRGRSETGLRITYNF
jgi:hypothetical protein